MGKTEPFGQIAIRLGFATSAQVQAALEVQDSLRKAGRPRLIGMIMLEMGVLGTTELIEVLRDMNLPGVVARRAVLKSPS